MPARKVPHVRPKVMIAGHESARVATVRVWARRVGGCDQHSAAWLNVHEYEEVAAIR
jgi:hypothetical protein